MGCVQAHPQPAAVPGTPRPNQDGKASSSVHRAANGKPVINKYHTPEEAFHVINEPPRMKSQQYSSRTHESGELSSSASSSRLPQGKKVHRANVFTKGFNKDFQSNRHPKTEAEMDNIVRILDSCYVFTSCSYEQKEQLAQYMFPVRVNPGAVVVRQGDTSAEGTDYFYAIERGTFDFFVDGQNIARRTGANQEAYFGELALLYDSPRQATAICVSASNDPSSNTSPLGENIPKLWALGRDTFRQVLALSNELQREERKLAVQSISILKETLSEEQLNRVIECVNLFHFRAGQRIVRKGDPGDSCYFIKQGQVLCTKIGEDQLGQIELGPGSFFGERALLRDEPRAADVTAITDVIAMALDRKSFDELLGPLRAVMDDKMKERVVEALPILKELSPQLRREVVSDFELETFRQDDEIVRAGDTKCDKFYVVRAGEVAVYDPTGIDSDKPIAVLKEGSWFGEMALLNDEPRTATCVAASPRVECFVLRRATFQQLRTGSKILAVTSEQRRQSNMKRRHSDAASFTSGSFREKRDGYSSGDNEEANETKVIEQKVAIPPLESLEKHNILGKGTFGTVFLVREQVRATKINRSPSPSRRTTYFALKMMNKHNLVRCEQKNNVLNEKRVLLACANHPFVLRLYSTYQDADSLYFLLEFVPGGELFSIMQEKYRFPLYPTMFYAACLADVLEHIHAQHIIYRDLKPENVLIDKFGYVKLADFGFAKKVTDKTYTLCGTPEYLAPEVVLGTGHDKGVDWWGLGVLVYEMLVGISPFASEYDEHSQVVCNNIVKGRVHYDKMTRALAETESKPDPFWTMPASSYTRLPSRDGASHGLPGTPSSPSRRGFSSLRVGSSASRSSGAVSASSGVLPVEDFVRKVLNKNPLQRLGNLKDGSKDIKRHPFFAEVQDWVDLRDRKMLAPFIPPLSAEDDTSRFDVFEADVQWPSYMDENDWCKDF